MSLRYIAFDLDGTLVDSVPDLTQALQMMLADLDRPTVNVAEVTGWIGNGADIMIRRALSRAHDHDPRLDPSLVAKARERFNYHYEHNGHEKNGAISWRERDANCLAPAGLSTGRRHQ